MTQISHWVRVSLSADMGRWLWIAVVLFTQTTIDEIPDTPGQALLDGYVRQLELAKVDEAKEGPAVQVVDEAKAPEMRAKPERKKMVVAYTVTGLIIAFVLAVLRAFMRNIKSTSEGQQRLSQLKRAWGFA